LLYMHKQIFKNWA